MMTRLRVAVGCLTIVPLGPRGRVLDRDLGGSFVWFPLVGLGIGWCLVFVYQAASQWAVPLAAAALTVTALVILTGALHLDGLADVCDALAGGRTVDDRLRIMKDPHVGAIAVVGLICVVLLKVTLIASVSSAEVLRALVVMPCLGRYAMVALGTTLPSARAGGGTAGPFVAHGTRTALAGATLVAGVVLAVACGGAGWWVAGAAGLAIVLLRWAALHWFGGVTGDILGAAGEVVELVALIAMAGMV